MFLLDTHTFLWFLEDDPKIPKNVKETLWEFFRYLKPGT